MPDPLVSVLLPVFDAQDTVGEALTSLSAQSLEDFEIVVIDDGSGDGSVSAVATYARREPRLRLIAAPHEGLIAALNRGLSACRGRYVARMDADDLTHPQRLGRQVQLLDERPEVSVVGTLVDAFPAATVGEGLRIYLEWQNGLISGAEIRREIFIESPITHPSAMFRRCEILAVGGYQEHGWPEDYDLWLRLHVAGKAFAKVPEVLLSWREHPRRLTHCDRRYSVENFLRAKAHYLIAGPLRGRDAVFVWGSGKTGRRLSKHLIRGGCTPDAFIDISPRRIGSTLRQVPIIGPADLRSRWTRWNSPILLAAVASRGARQLIREELRRQGLTEGEDFLCVA